MIWVDDDFADHPKFIGLDGDTITTWLRGIGYCNRFRTDGEIPTGALPSLARCKRAERCAAELVRVGLWEKTDDGWHVHDFADYQFTKAESEARKAEKSAAGKKGAEKRWGSKQNDSSSHGRPMAGAMADGCDSDATGMAERCQTDSPSPLSSTKTDLPPNPPAGGMGRKGRRGKEGPDADDRYREAWIAGVLDAAPGAKFTPPTRMGLRFANALTAHAQGLRGDELLAWIRAKAAEWVRSCRYLRVITPGAFVQWLDGQSVEASRSQPEAEDEPISPARRPFPSSFDAIGGGGA